MNGCQVIRSIEDFPKQGSCACYGKVIDRDYKEGGLNGFNWNTIMSYVDSDKYSGVKLIVDHDCEETKKASESLVSVR